MFQERQLQGAARPLVEFGLPPGEEVDAVFSWPFNGKTYLIRGQKYWRYDEVAGSPDPDYPRPLSLWEGAPFAPDDVTISNTGVEVLISKLWSLGEKREGGRWREGMADGASWELE